MPAVQERADPFAVRAERRLGLRDLVVVVRELEVYAARVHVEPVACDGARHDRTLDVPAGPALAPRRWPRRLARLRRLPQREVGRRALLALHRVRNRKVTCATIEPIRTTSMLGKHRKVIVDTERLLFRFRFRFSDSILINLKPLVMQMRSFAEFR